MKLLFKSFTALSIAAFAAALQSCGSDKTTTDPNLIASNDYEAVVGWGGNPNDVTRDRAHSGKYAIMVGPGKDFGMGYGLPIGQASVRKPHKIKISAWGYMTDAKSMARLGMQITEPDTNKEIFGDGIDFKDAVKDSKKWVEISKEITLPDNITSAQMLRVFLWRGNAETPAYLDDLKISLVD